MPTASTHDADRQHPQGLDRIVRHHPVIHVLHEQGAGQGKQIDEKGRHQHIAIDAPRLRQGAPEPVTAALAGGTGRAFVETVLGLDVEHMPAVARGQLVERQFDGTGARLGVEDGRSPFLSIDRREEAGMASATQQHHRQHQRRDLAQLALQKARRQAGATRRARKQLGREIAALQRKSGGQRIRRGRTPFQPCQQDKRVQQGIVEGLRNTGDIPVIYCLTRIPGFMLKIAHAVVSSPDTWPLTKAIPTYRTGNSSAPPVLDFPGYFVRRRISHRQRPVSCQLESPLLGIHPKSGPSGRTADAVYSYSIAT